MPSYTGMSKYLFSNNSKNDFFFLITFHSSQIFTFKLFAKLHFDIFRRTTLAMVTRTLLLTFSAALDKLVRSTSYPTHSKMCESEQDLTRERD
jgi:hypothetical protein